MELAIGNTIGDYQVVGMLGAGGMGKVYKVRNVISDRIEAMKILLPDLAAPPDFADRFSREIKLLASLEHPNITALRTALRVENQLLMVMEFVEGVTLEQRLKASGPLPVAEACGYISQVLSALAFAHARQVVHRDVKPANMMLTGSGLVKLMDFGIAKVTADHRLTMTGTTMGSLYYMSPEQIRGEQDLDARADLYSVGVSLYELVTGKRPFDGDSQFAIMSAHLEKNPVPPIEICPALPASLNEIILTSVAKDREQRFQKAEAFRNALESVLPQPENAAVVAPPVAASGSPRRGLWIATGALVTAGVVIGVVQMGPWRKASAGAGGISPAVSQPASQAAPVQASPQEQQPAAAPSAPTAQAPPMASPPRDAPPVAAHRESPAVARPSPVEAHRTAPARPAAALPAEQPPPPQPQHSAAVPAPSAPAPPAANPEELQSLRERMVMLAARASAVQTSLDNLQRAQSSSGLGMRRDWVESAGLMKTFLDGANSALNASDAASAKRFLERAEGAVERLEKALGR